MEALCKLQEYAKVGTLFPSLSNEHVYKNWIKENLEEEKKVELKELQKLFVLHHRQRQGQACPGKNFH